MQKIFTYLLVFFYCPARIYAQLPDTLTAVVVKSIITAAPTQSSVPLQTIQVAALGNTQSIADAIKQFAGVQVKDYGGMGGLKTVSVRSLGANHTGVLYDGAALGDAQGGQVDLGKFALDNVAQIQLYNSNPTDILLPARAFSYANILVIKSSSSAKSIAAYSPVKLKLHYGSFQNFSSSLSLHKIFKQKLYTHFHAWYQTAKNNYPFLSYENIGTTSTRTNSQIKAYRAEYDVQYKRNDSNVIQLKVFYYASKRGLPGSIILYNNTANQSLADNNFFLQSNWKYAITKNNTLLVTAKITHDHYFYLDPFYPNNTGKLENKFRQQEQYLSAVFKQKITIHLSASVATDFFYSQLRRTDAYALNFANPSRQSFLQNITLKYKKERYEIQSNVLYTNITEQVKTTTAANNLKALTPALSATWQPLALLPIQLRFFYKNIFRAPTFNDLYYTNIGNTNLKPEYAQQLNIGVTYHAKRHTESSENYVTVDAYVNKVSNKILAVPKQNLFQWSMQNVGKVSIKGIDATAHILMYKNANVKLQSNLSYTYQKARDVSNKSSNQYNTQLPYTPVHTGSVAIAASLQSWQIYYTILASSLRYRQGETTSENRLPSWLTNDFSLAYKANKSYSIIAEANNIFNSTYEIIKYYPMPRFNYKITLHVNF